MGKVWALRERSSKTGQANMDLTALQTNGWMLVDGISSEADLLELGRAIGSPVPTPNGELVKEIRRISPDEAPPGSQSAIYGFGPFPLHTDTVFWPLPVRYVLLRAYGDTRRPTTVKSFSELLHECDPQIEAFARSSVWVVRAGNKRFYCSCRFQHEGLVGWRYDFDLMSPANHAAVEVDRAMRPLAKTEGNPISWSGDTAAVICNWICLHGRGAQPPDEGIRIVQRLYVR